MKIALVRLRENLKDYLMILLIFIWDLKIFHFLLTLS